MTIPHALLIVITGSIASGKSTLARALAARLRAEGRSAAVIDLDLVYEMLADDPKSDDAAWAAARRLAGGVAAELFRQGIAVVVVEGEFWTSAHRTDLTARIPAGTTTTWASLNVSFREALRRAQGDSSRGISKDPAFLRVHLEQYQAALPELRSTGRVIETDGVPPETVVEELLEGLLSLG